MVTSVFRRANTMYVVENGGSSGESSRRPSAVDAPRRPSLAALSLRLSSRSKKSTSVKDYGVETESAQKLWEALLSLPDEITAQVLCYLSLADILALRLSSRSVHTYLQYHAGPITRSILLQNAYQHTTDYEGGENHERAQYFYNYIHTIYPLPRPCISFEYLLRMLKRQCQVQSMLNILTSWIQMKIYIFPKFKRCDNFNPYKHSMTRRLTLAAWTIYHFLESYRTMLLTEHPSHRTGPSQDRDQSRCTACLQAVNKLLQVYPGKDIIPAYHFYELCRQHLHASSRAPSAGRLRAKKSTSDVDMIQLIVFGGVPELCKLSLLKGSSNQRIEAIAVFVDKISSAAIQQKIRGNGSSSSSQKGGPTSFDDLISPLQTPLHLIQFSTISALPEIDHFIAGTDEWVTQMYSRVGRGDQIVSAWGFITNILTEKSKDADSEAGRYVSDLDSDLDFLAPVKSFEE